MSRANTMARLALHRLADTDLPGLRVGLDAADEAAVGLGEEMTGMRIAAEREAAARRTRGLAGPGPYEIAYRGARNVLAGCILIVEDTELPDGLAAPLNPFTRLTAPASVSAVRQTERRSRRHPTPDQGVLAVSDDPTEQSPLTAAQEALRENIPDHMLWEDTDALGERDMGRYPVVLAVKGMLIAGRPVSAEEWFEFHENGLDEGHVLPFGMSLVQRNLEKRREEREAAYALPEGTEYTEEQKAALLNHTGFIYLLDGRYVFGSTFVPTQGDGIAIRVDYSSVDAWSYGTITKSD